MSDNVKCTQQRNIQAFKIIYNSSNSNLLLMIIWSFEHEDEIKLLIIYFQKASENV